MMKLLVIASFVAFGASAAFAMPKVTPADTEEVASGENESDVDSSLDYTGSLSHEGCPCGKGRSKK
jgi:hypothetical protein